MAIKESTIRSFVLTSMAAQSAWIGTHKSTMALRMICAFEGHLSAKRAVRILDDMARDGEVVVYKTTYRTYVEEGTAPTSMTVDLLFPAGTKITRRKES